MMLPILGPKQIIVLPTKVLKLPVTTMVAITLLSSGGAHLPSIVFHDGNVTPCRFSHRNLMYTDLHDSSPQKPL